MVKRARKTDALSLPPGKANTPPPYDRVEAEWQFSFNEIQYLRHGASFTQLRTINFIIEQAKRHVARNRVVDEKNILWHIANGRLPRRDQVRCERLIINQAFAG